MNNENPYSKDGYPIEGKEKEFFQWAREQELQRQDKLSPEEKSQLKDAESNMTKKMNS